MAEDKPDETGDTAGPQRPKRAPPTIDLEAKDISRKDEAPEAAPDEPAAGTVPEPDTVVPETQTQGPSASEQSHRPSQRRSALLSSALIALLAGALAGVVVAGIAARMGWLSPDADATKIETPAVPLAERASVDALAARMRAVEAKQASPAPFDSALAGRVDALERGITDLGKEVAALRAQQAAVASAIEELKASPRASETPATAPALSAVTARLDQIEKATQALTAAAASQPKSAPADDKPLRRVIAATLLEQTVRHGEPFAAALGAVKPFADAAVLKPLEQFAATGVPTAHTLCAELLTLVPAPESQAPKIADDAGFVDRLKAGAERLVRIRRTSPEAGGSRDAVLSRAQAAARRDDLAAARQQVSSLAAADRGSLQAWLDKVEARDAALAAARRLVADASAALAKPSP